MSDETRREDSERDDEDRIEILLEQGFQPDAEFLRRIRGRIERRHLARDVVRVALIFPVSSLYEFVKMLSFASSTFIQPAGERKPWRKHST